VIVISHDRHFLNSVCTHIADIDYETIITYTGTYDDMVVAKTQIRSQIEAQNAQREKKIAQLNEFIARFAAGTRSSQVQSRRKEVERLQVTELARSNIQRPYIKFEQKRPSGPPPYAANIKFSDLKMSAAENFVGATVNYLDGTVSNAGNQMVTHVMVEVTFKDSMAQLAQRETVPLRVLQASGPYPDAVDLSASPLAPGQSKPFRLTFEGISSQWNHEYPELKVVDVTTK